VELSVPIDGATLLTAIIADPVAQARTPRLLNSALARRGVNAALVPMHVPAGDLRAAIEGLRVSRNFAGAVISMPHKRTIVALLDELTREASDVGACNVIRRQPNGALLGTMLDGHGFVTGLRQAGIAVDGRRVLLIGAGGAAAGIAFALAANGIATLAIHNRTADAATILAARLARSFPAVEVRCDVGDSTGHDLVVNATSLGMRSDDALPIDVARLDANAVAAEAVLAPDETQFLVAAAARGLRTHRGRHMLEAQIEPMIDFMLG
jgi:shikimate dehydrogenase